MVNNIALAGCGNVGTALLEILNEKQEELAEKYNFEFRVTLITDLMKGTILDVNGLDLDKVIEALHTKHSFEGFKQTNRTFEELLEEAHTMMLAEATPTDLRTGEPGLTHIRSALARGINVTTTSKGPLAIDFSGLSKLANDCGAQLRYEGSVMSGTPLIEMLTKGMAGCTISKVEGILNGTTNFMLTEMANGLTYANALEEATSLGYAEADPSGDVEGWDAAAKVVILAKIIFGKDITVEQVERMGITQVTPDKIKEAKEAGFAVKLIAGLENGPYGLRAYVTPKEIPLGHPLAFISGATNAVTITTDNLGDVTLSGPGAGRRETGQALLTDLIAMSL